ncbi:LysR substrate-binding domain-containing protein [Maritimibacter dapengensis]|uniref:LysR family transcriptional regulator n=1 Tax=Maritimibacter dapengensis TaxID=2836868 RepID=A0ABS6T2P1_9RHOB|nr:LysR substrate-binding domain-containing protein [Maritimibacter dapengensis]MBV7379525.1 LysR family transcriptional regulator [Maritimibacter dapengensis]
MTDLDWNRLPPLSALRAFEATARLRGFSPAARALNVTPAAIAQQVRKLEKELGTALVRREGRGVVLTSAGRHLAGSLRAGFAMLSDGVEEVRRLEASRGIRVSTTQFFVDAVILPHLGDFWTRHPGVQVTFAPEGNRQPIDLDAFDICIRARQDPGEWTGSTTQRLLASPFIVCAAPSLLESSGRDLSALPWLYDPHNVDALDSILRQAGLDRDAIEIVDTGSPHLELEAAVAGYGLSISTEILIRPHVADGRLVVLDKTLSHMTTYYAISRKGPKPAPVTHFLEWLNALCLEQGVTMDDTARTS